MRRIRKRILAAIIILILTILPAMTSYADNNSDTGANAGGDDGQGAWQGPVTNYDGYPTTVSRTGWLVYIVEDTSSALSIDSATKKPVQVSDTLVFYTSSKRPDDCQLKGTTTRFGKPIDWNSNLQSTWGAPYENSGKKCIGKGTYVKGLLMQDNALEFKNIIHTYFNDYEAEFTTTGTRKLALVMEPFFWMGVYQNHKYTHRNYCGTAYGWAELYNKMGMPKGDGWVNTYTHGNFPNCAKLEYPMWGLTPLSGQLTGDQIMNSGNGFIVFWPGRNPVPPSPTPPQQATSTGKVLYEIRNWSDEFDISRGIPSGETVKNEMRADTFYGSAKVYETASNVKDYTATYTYRWVEHIPEIKDIYGNTIQQGKDVTHYRGKSVQFSAYTKYQYASEIQLFSYYSLMVNNKAFAYHPIYNSALLKEYPIVTPDVVRYTADGDYVNDKASLGFTADAGSHYYFPASIPDRTIDVGSESEISSAHSTAVAEAKAFVYNNSWSANDRIKVNVKVGTQDVQYVFMDDTKVQGCIIPGSYNTTAAESAYKYGANGYDLDTVKPVKVTQTEEILIPSSTDNKDYPTGIQAYYKNIVNTIDTTDKVYYSGRYWYQNGDSIYDHVISGATNGTKFDLEDSPTGDGYPIKVHTPVIAPIVITDNYGLDQTIPDNQLIDVDENAQYQLKLDSWYMVKWRQDLWVSAIWGDIPGYGDSGINPSKYDEYVLMKQIKFPFDVYYNGEFVEAGNWIIVEEPNDYLQEWNDNIDYINYESKNHWTMTPIYIPSYSQEGSGTIEARVYADNTYGRYDGSHDSMMEVEMNTDQKNYVATYSVKDQLSGHIYGFSVVGVDDTDMYNYIDLDKNLHDRIEYPLASVKEEKVAGKLNRHNTAGYRFLKDGSITEDVADYNLLPLRDGSNETAGLHMGDGRLWMGTGFSFNLKTIANLWNDNDYIEIRPTFKIYSPDGSLKYTYTPDGTLQRDKDFVILYEDTLDGNKLKIFGGPEDNTIKTCFMGYRLFDESYYTEEDTYTDNGTTTRYGDWVNYTLERWNKTHGLTGTNAKTEYDMMEKGYQCYTNSSIILDKNLRMLSGEYEQLYKNRRRTDSNLVTYFDWNSDGVNEGSYSSDEVIRFRDSMQSWYGYYCMPGILYIYDGSWDELKQKDSFSLADDFLHEDEIGDIIINFDIIAYKDGKAHLQYGGIMNGGRVWEIEGYDRKDKYDWGDVVTYDSQHRWADKKTGYAVMIN